MPKYLEVLMSSISKCLYPSVHVAYSIFLWALTSALIIIFFPTGSVELPDFEGSRFCPVFYRQHLDNVLSSRVESSFLMRFVAQLQQICSGQLALPY